MEDVLEVYHRPFDRARPLVNLDEFSKQLLSDKTSPLPPRPGSSRKVDYEYVREGSASAYMLALPHLGLREVFMSESSTQRGVDFAHALEYLAEEILPDAEKIVLVMDNLATHTEASLYKAFPPEKARALCERFEMHYTPKHGSWLNMAEIEIGKIVNHGLKERIGSRENMRASVKAYCLRENKRPKPIKWQLNFFRAVLRT